MLSRDDAAGFLGTYIAKGILEIDPFISVDEARATGGRVRVFEGVGHLPALERPDEFNELLDELL